MVGGRKSMSDTGAVSPVIRIEKLTKHFPGVLANDSISLFIDPGEIHCLLGENGAGKTTFAECLNGTYRPDSGRVFYKGERVEFSSPRDAISRGIGMVHQHFELVPPMTVIENIIVGTESKGIRLNLDSASKKINRLCETYGIELDLGAVVSRLPVGKQQWVEILKTLYVGVEFLILDEPTAVLTPQEIENFFRVLRKMVTQGLSILLITHKLNEVMDVSHRVTVLRKGKLIATVNTDAMTRQELARKMVGRDVVFLLEKEAVEPGSPVLEFINVVTETINRREALQGLSLMIKQGEILGLAGVAGNGQGQIFDVITGVGDVQSGEVLLNGEDVTDSTPWMRISKGLAIIPEDRIHDGLLMSFPVRENFILGNHKRRIFRKGPFLDFKEIDAFSRQKIDEFSIAVNSPMQKVKTLSGGNLQKVILAREFSQNPKLLIANQPTRGLDVGAIEYVHHRLLDLRKSGTGILLISEELDEIFQLADTIAVIFRGQIRGLFDTDNADIEKIGLLMAGVGA